MCRTNGRFLASILPSSEMHQCGRRVGGGGVVVKKDFKMVIFLVVNKQREHRLSSGAGELQVGPKKHADHDCSGPMTCRSTPKVHRLGKPPM